MQCLAEASRHFECLSLVEDYPLEDVYPVFPNLVVAFVSFDLSDSQSTQFQSFFLCVPQTISPPTTTKQFCVPSKHDEFVQCGTKGMRVQKKREALKNKNAA